jgi:hypothetical protein
MLLFTREEWLGATAAQAPADLFGLRPARPGYRVAGATSER